VLSLAGSAPTRDEQRLAEWNKHAESLPERPQRGKPQRQAGAAEALAGRGAKVARQGRLRVVVALLQQQLLPEVVAVIGVLGPRREESSAGSARLAGTSPWQMRGRSSSRRKASTTPTRTRHTTQGTGLLTETECPAPIRQTVPARSRKSRSHLDRCRGFSLIL